jgi:hypothetical protein
VEEQTLGDENQIKYVINHDLHELGDWPKRLVVSFNPDKTEIMIYKNVENSTNFNFYFDGKLIPLTSDHKHLGITFSEETKWNKHVENLIKSVSKHIRVLRKLKYKLNRNNLKKLYLIYIRPIFEYACEVWDNCGVSNLCKLERLQLEAARIITGLPFFTNTEYLYRERLRLFHFLTVAGTKESLVKESLQNGTIISLPFEGGK